VRGRADTSAASSNVYKTSSFAAASIAAFGFFPT
jgi:hypothetical protein